jgi:hypothetical protein
VGRPTLEDVYLELTAESELEASDGERGTASGSQAAQATARAESQETSNV